MVIVPFELSVGSPDVRGEPIVYRVGIEDIRCYLVGPFQMFVAVIIPVPMDGLPTMITFLCTDADKATCSLGFLLLVIPFSESDLEVIVPHFFREEIKVFFPIACFGHVPDPQVLELVFPGTPETLVHGRASRHFERDTYP